MTTYGKQYEADYTPDNGKTVRQTRRAVYRTSGDPTPEQKFWIDKMEKGLHDDWEGARDPYGIMRRVEELGVEFEEECQTLDGKWKRMDDPDVPLTNMTAGAL